MHQLIRHADYRKGTWRNGLGVSWDIASDAGGEAFTWRFAIARIDGDVPFSHYPGIDRVFTLLGGKGLDLDIMGIGTLAVPDVNVPTPFPGDRETHCRLRHGTCRALNLFLKRRAMTAVVDIVNAKGTLHIGHEGLSLVFVLRGSASVDGQALEAEDTFIADGAVSLSASPDARLYVARLSSCGA